jgi:hypothetical protein
VSFNIKTRLVKYKLIVTINIIKVGLYTYWELVAYKDGLRVAPYKDYRNK